MLARKKLSSKTNLKQNEEIEILDFEEEKKAPKLRLKIPRIKVKNRKTFAIGTIAVLVLSIFTLLIIPGQNIVKTGVKKFLDSVGIYTEEIKSVEIQSDDYNSPGSWHIDKSAEWIGLNKAQVTFDVNTIAKMEGNYKDIILVIDISESMAGSKRERAISDAKELVSYVLTDTNNRVAIITFEDTSTIVSGFSNNADELLQKLDEIVIDGFTNYDAALKNVDVVMNGYVKESNRDVVTLFLTDGYPNIDTPNQIGTYESLKEKYPYMTINGIQYEMGRDIIDEIKQISDAQWSADQLTLNNILFEASVSPLKYEDFIITDYISENFKVNSVDDVVVTVGTVALEEESGLQKIIWNLGTNTYMASRSAKMTINLTLKDQYIETGGFYPTNSKEIIESKLPGEAVKTVNSTKTPVLKGMYEVIYDTNTPDGCTLPAIASEKHLVYQSVTKKTDTLSCDGYLFKGWQMDDTNSEDITKINDDVFIMPEHNVTIRATWSRQSIAKSMNGKVSNKTTLYKVLEETAKAGTYAKEYTDAHQDSMNPYASTAKIYYYYGSSDTNGTAILDKNNVIFAGQCWQMIRTTDTGGIKMIYNGEAVDNKCLSSRGTHIGYAEATTQTLTSNYWYGTDYTYDSTAKTFKISGTTEQVTWNETTGPNLVGKYTCKLTEEDGTCSTLYLVESYYTNRMAYAIPLNSSSHYSQFGRLQFNKYNRSLAYAGYMYGDTYEYKSMYQTTSQSFVTYSSSTPGTIAVGDSITDNGDGTYTINNPVTVSQWWRNYASCGKKYTCLSTTTTCSSPIYIASVSSSSYYYIRDAVAKILLGKSRDGLTLTDTILVTKSELAANSSKYSDYKYTCNTESDTCTESTLRIITKIDTTGYDYAPNYYYGSSVTWDGTNYTLENTIDREEYYNDLTKINTNHYVCLVEGAKSCTEVAYVFNRNGSYMYYVTMKNGEKSISDVIQNMFTKNTTDSTIKVGVEAWYKKYLLNYDNYIEDTVFCYDRSINEYAGWAENGSMSKLTLEFKEYYPGTSDLKCSNVADQYSVSNPSAKLTYKVGLMSAPEMNIMNSLKARSTGQGYLLGSPFSFDSYHYYVAATSLVVENGFVSSNSDGIGVRETGGVRPAISLKPDTEYVAGDGSMANPYIVETE